MRVEDGTTQTPSGLDAAWVLVMLVTTTSLTGLGLSVMIVAFPAIRLAFPHASAAQLSWISNLFTIVSAAVLIPCGVLADRLGRKRMLLIGTLLFLLGSLVGALAPSPAWIMIGRTLQALGTAAYGPAGMALLVSVFPAERLVYAISIWSIAGGASSALAPALGGWLIDHGGWRWAFWINLPLCVVTLALGPFVLRETTRDRTKRLPDLVGVVLVMAATSVITLGVVQSKDAPGWGWLGRWTLLSAVAGVVLVALFVARCRRTPHPLVRLDQLRVAGVQIGSYGLIVQNLGYFGAYWAFVQHLIDQWHWSASRAGVVTIPVSLLAGAVAFVTSSRADRSGPRPFILASIVAQVASFAYLWIAIGRHPSVAAAVLGAALLGAGGGLAIPSLCAMTLRGLPVAEHALGSALNSMAQRIGATFGTALAITFVASEAGLAPLRHTLVAATVAIVATLPLAIWAGRIDPGA